MDKTDESCSMLRCCADDERGWAVAIEALDPCTPINRRRGTRRSYDPIVAHDRKLLHSIGCLLHTSFKFTKAVTACPDCLIDRSTHHTSTYIRTYSTYVMWRHHRATYPVPEFRWCLFVCLFVALLSAALYYIIIRIILCFYPPIINHKWW